MSSEHNWRLKAFATDIDKDGFSLHLDSWADTIQFSASAAWIVYPADKKGIFSGSFSTEDVRSWDNPQLNNGGRVEFPPGSFEGDTQLKVLIGLNGLDIDHRANLRLKVSADSVSKEGMNWHLDGWADTVLYSAGASYLAFV